MDQAVARARSAAEQSQIQLEFSGNPDLPPVDIDCAQIDRAVSNLIDYAIKYTPAAGGVAVSMAR